MTSASLPKIKGFDRQGEPELRAAENGALELVFNCMPPLTASGEERSPDLFENFEKVLSTHAGAAVTRDDREVFLIAKPNADTAEKLAAYLSSFWKDHAEALKAQLAAVPRPANAPFRNEKELYAALTERLAPVLKPLGFKPFKFLDVSFRRKMDFGNEMLTISVTYLGTHYRPSGWVFATHDIVERIYAMASNMEKRFLKGQWTSQEPLILASDGQAENTLLRPSDLDAWVPRFIESFKSAGVAQLARLSDLALIERTCNDQSVRPPVYLSGPRPDAVAGKGLIIAKLLSRDDIADIAAFHQESLAQIESVNSYPEVKPRILSTSREDLIEQAKAW